MLLLGPEKRSKALDSSRIWGLRNNDCGLWLNSIAWGDRRVAKLMTYTECEKVAEDYPDVEMEIWQLRY